MSEKRDIVDSLRIAANLLKKDGYKSIPFTVEDAADEIERLRAEVEDLLAALDRQGKEDRP